MHDNWLSVLFTGLLCILAKQSPHLNDMRIKRTLNCVSVNGHPPAGTRLSVPD